LIFGFKEQNPPPSVSNVTKIAQFGKGVRKIWGVQGGLVFGDG